MRRFQTGPSGQFATHHSGWSRAKDVPRLATAIFEDRGTSCWALRLRKPTVLEMPLSFIEQLGNVLLSQQCVVAGLLLAAIVYLAWQLATERAARERDRETAKHEAAERTRAVEALALALAKIEGFLGH